MSDLRRCDWAVILARGESQRMGRPKGLCRLPDDDDPFLVRIARLYGTAGLPVAVVTTGRLRRLYEPAVTSGAVQRWIERAPGAGTAASAGAALAVLAGTASHLWLHPVDLPEVRAASLHTLRARSQAEPNALLVACYGDRPGHPVVMPVASFQVLADPDLPGRMCDRLREVCDASGDRRERIVRRLVALDDPGVVADYDDPADLLTRTDDQPSTPPKEEP